MLLSPQFLAIADEAFLRDAIKYGRPGTPMSGWGEIAGGPLSEDDVGHLVAYIGQWRTDLMPELGGEHTGQAQRGEPVYAVYCASCHGDTGEGKTALKQ